MAEATEMDELMRLAARTGKTLLPIVYADQIEMLILRFHRFLPPDQVERLRDLWNIAVAGTALQDVRLMVLSDKTTDFVVVPRP